MTLISVNLFTNVFVALTSVLLTAPDMFLMRQTAIISLFFITVGIFLEVGFGFVVEILEFGSIEVNLRNNKQSGDYSGDLHEGNEKTSGIAETTEVDVQTTKTSFIELTPIYVEPIISTKSVTVDLV